MISALRVCMSAVGTYLLIYILMSVSPTLYILFLPVPLLIGFLGGLIAGHWTGAVSTALAFLLTGAIGIRNIPTAC